MVYYTPGGVYYHLVEDCSGMRNASAHSISSANADRKKPCPTCFGEGVIWVRCRTERSPSILLLMKSIRRSPSTIVETELTQA